MCRENGLWGGVVLRVVDTLGNKNVLEIFTLGISAGDLFQNGTARMLTAYLLLRVQLVRLKCAVKCAFTGKMGEGGLDGEFHNTTANLIPSFAN